MCCVRLLLSIYIHSIIVLLGVSFFGIKFTVRLPGADPDPIFTVTHIYAHSSSIMHFLTE